METVNGKDVVVNVNLYEGLEFKKSSFMCL